MALFPASTTLLFVSPAVFAITVLEPKEEDEVRVRMRVGVGEGRTAGFAKTRE